MSDLSGRVAVVTGAGRGIGAAIAARLAEDGAQVAVADVDLAAATDTAAHISAAGKAAFAAHVDVTEPSSAQHVMDSVIDRTGRLDILVNNAGISGVTVPVVDYPIDEWRRVLAIDLDGVFYCCKAALPHMLARQSGRIVNVASIAGKEGNPNLSAYSAAKAGVIGLTKSLGKELARSGIVVNCVTPAVIATAMNQTVSEETLRYMLSRVPMGRIGQVGEVAALVAWLASDECSFSTGAVFDISGGRATY